MPMRRLSVPGRAIWAALAAAFALWSPSPALAANGFVPATDLDGAIGNDLSAGPNVASAPDGTAFMAWVKPGSPARALVAVRPPGGAWNTQDLGPTVQTINGGIPIGASADGTATVLTIDEGGTVVRVSTRPPGGTFGAPRPLTPGDRPVAAMALAVNASGEAVAAWHENTTGSSWQPRAAFRDAGGWLPSTPLAPSQGPALPLTAAINDAGRSVVGFSVHDGTYLRARVSIRPAEGTFPVTADALDTDAIHSYNTNVAITAAGAIVAGYTTSPPATQTVPASPVAIWRIAAAGSAAWGAPQVLSGAGTNATQISVAAGPGDQLHATWLSLPSNRIEYFASTVGGVSGGRVLVSPPNESALMPKLVVDAAGNRLLLWTNLSSSLIQASYRPAGLPDFGLTQTVITSGGASGYTKVSAAMDAQGNAVVGWPRPDGHGNTIAQAAGYDVAAPTLTGASIPATLPATAPGPFSVIATDVWSTPAVRWSFGDGASATGPSVDHAYGGPGIFTATATATDGVGNAASIGAPVQIGSAPDVDLDRDGFPRSRDCDDGNAAVRPGVRDVPGNKVDENCNGSDATFRVLNASVELTWIRRVGRAPTRIVTLRLDGVRDGDRVTVRCKGSGCAKKVNRTRVLKKVKRGKVSLTGSVGGLQLRPGAQLSVAIAREDSTTKIFGYAMRRGKNPAKTTRCQTPGEKKARAC